MKSPLIELWRQASGRCALCGAEVPEPGSAVPFTSFAATRDHIIPASLGGADAMANLRMTCRACNGARSDAFPFGAIPGADEAVQEAVWLREEGRCGSCRSARALQFLRYPHDWPGAEGVVVLCSDCVNLVLQAPLVPLRDDGHRLPPGYRHTDAGAPVGPRILLDTDAVRRIDPYGLALSHRLVRRLYRLGLAGDDDRATLARIGPQLAEDLRRAPILTFGDYHVVHGDRMAWKISIDGVCLFQAVPHAGLREREAA